MEYTYQYQSPMGEILLASDGYALTGAWFKDQKYYGATLENQTKEGELPVFLEACKWLDIYFEGKDPGPIPPVSMKGSPFRQKVWNVLKEIPYGRTITYGHIANELAREGGIPSMSAQAVGGAVGHNPISIMIPCHRVIGSKGNLTGYAGGIQKKEALLRLEGHVIEEGFIKEE